ncbi:winged helix-turn-helix domain-containing protein [Peteryoungia desertarenae]|uniref:winged helix-turn-helix domain-containing protein n=1 Tax=Peteryoungia desertarenae TaxID=1813451 RepID=UPI003CCE0789
MAKAARVTLRIDLANGARLGPGKADLLALIAEHGSIRAAGAALGMSYRRAWLLADEINRMFREPSIFTRHGGKSGGELALRTSVSNCWPAANDWRRKASARWQTISPFWQRCRTPCSNHPSHRSRTANRLKPVETGHPAPERPS